MYLISRTPSLLGLHWNATKEQDTLAWIWVIDNEQGLNMLMHIHIYNDDFCLDKGSIG